MRLPSPPSSVGRWRSVTKPAAVLAALRAPTAGGRCVLLGDSAADWMREDFLEARERGDPVDPANAESSESGVAYALLIQDMLPATVVVVRLPKPDEDAPSLIAVYRWIGRDVAVPDSRDARIRALANALDDEFIASRPVFG